MTVLLTSSKNQPFEQRFSRPKVYPAVLNRSNQKLLSSPDSEREVEGDLNDAFIALRGTSGELGTPRRE
jgi:hypothetical protein